jgi:glycosyltransferase involved in cell wall biosynthesis
MKNLPRLIEAFARLKQERRIPHVLLMVGGETPIVTRRGLMELAAHLEVADSVIFPGVVPHALILAFYVNAAVTAMPSLYETFGCPVLEAMSCGCPVVTSQGGTMAEIAQGCAVLVNPYQVQSIADGIARVLEDPELRQHLITSGLARAQDFTLEAQAQGYLAALEKAGNESLH